MSAAGDRFGRLVLQSEAGRANDGHKLWNCICDCGAAVVRQSNAIRRGTPSCGCAVPELMASHGMRYTGTYSSWQSAKQRCMNPEAKDYQRYGARGITMCQRWVESFDAFYEDMGKRPAGKTLERDDVNGNYEPGNCTWATVLEQNRNRRRSVYVEWQGTRMHLAEVAASIGITYGAAFNRLQRGKLT